MLSFYRKLAITFTACAYFFLATSMLLSQEEEIIETVIAPAGSEMAETMSKQEKVFDKNGRLVRIVHYYSEKASKELGYSTQTDIYNGLSYPTKFIMIFTPEMQEEKGFLRRIEIVDESDTLLSIQFDLTDSESFIAHDYEIQALGKFPIHSMGGYIKKYHEPLDRPNAYVIEAPLWRGTSYVQYMNMIEAIGPEELYLIKRWSEDHGAEGWEQHYSRRIQAREKDKLLWICFQDELIQYLEKDRKIVVQYYYIGASFKGPTFLAIYMRVVD